MLRESMQTSGKQVDLSGVPEGFRGGIEVPHAAELVAFAEAVVSRDQAQTAKAREKLPRLLGGAGLVDAAAVTAAFHGFVRIRHADELITIFVRLAATFPVPPHLHD